MYTRLITVKVATATIDEVTRLWQDEAVPAVRRQPGYVSGQLLIDRETGKGISMFTWESRAHADATGEGSQHLQTVLAKFVPYFLGPPVVEHLEVAGQG